MQRPKKIAFFFLDEIHHINHFISIAVALSKNHTVDILTYPGVSGYLEEALGRLGGDVGVKKLRTQLFRHITDKLKGREKPRKGFWINKNGKKIIETYDAIVFTDFDHGKFLKLRGSKSAPKFIKLAHGTPGRGYSINKRQLEFDLQLLPGPFFYEALKSKGFLTPNHALIGYPKIDAVPDASTTSFFQNDKPIVVYNPHFDPQYSSWKPLGLEVLEYFYNQDQYNLILAPHIHLFNKLGFEDANSIPQKYYDCDHIHIDLGSDASVNMVYVNTSDIYLGEISSQVYEFIIKPRPCIFINAHKANYINNPMFRFWQCGPVVDSISAFDEAIQNMDTLFKDYLQKQKEITAENYYSEKGKTASELAANAIIDFLEDN